MCVYVCVCVCVCVCVFVLVCLGGGGLVGMRGGASKNAKMLKIGVIKNVFLETLRARGNFIPSFSSQKL